MRWKNQHNIHWFLHSVYTGHNTEKYHAVQLRVPGEKKTFEELTSVLTYEGRFKVRMKCKKSYWSWNWKKMSYYFCVWVKAGGKRLCWRNAMSLNLDVWQMKNIGFGLRYHRINWEGIKRLMIWLDPYFIKVISSGIGSVRKQWWDLNRGGITCA